MTYLGLPERLPGSCYVAYMATNQYIPITIYPTSEPSEPNEQLAPPTSEQHQVSARLVEANERRNAGSFVRKRAVIP